MMSQIQKINDVPLLDKTIIKDKQWAENIWATLQNNLDRCFLYWCTLVLKMDENESVIKGWGNIFVKTCEDTYLQLLSNMEVRQSTALSQNQQLWQDLQQLSQTLQTNIPVFSDSVRRLTLRQEQEKLKKHIDEFQNLIQVRSTEAHKLNEKERDVCTSLGLKPKILKYNPLPLPEEIEEFQNYVVKLETQKITRLERFREMRQELLALIKELKRNPLTEFEKTLLSLEDSEFLVSDENMTQLEILRKTLINQQEDVKEQIANLWKKLNHYWNLLDIDLKERENFQKKYVGNSFDVLQALQSEIKRCEEFKTENLKVCTDKLRHQLKQLWDKCHCSQETRKKSEFFYTDSYTTDLLELHEAEINIWQKYFKENKELLTLLEKHQHLWNRMIDIEENAVGPNRYNNRGGQLLKEEKERNKLAKQIPQIEDMLHDLANRYKQYHNGTSFTTYGRSLTDYFANLHDERENAKKEKLSERKKQLKQINAPVKPAVNLSPSVSRNALHSDSPLSSSKRKFGTPVTEDAKKLKDSDRTTSIKRISVNGDETASPRSYTKYHSSDRKKQLEKNKGSNSQKEKADLTETVFSNNAEFQNELSNKSGVRSTLIPVERTPSNNPALSRTPSNDLKKKPSNEKYSKS